MYTDLYNGLSGMNNTEPSGWYALGGMIIVIGLFELFLPQIVLIGD